MKKYLIAVAMVFVGSLAFAGPKPVSLDSIRHAQAKLIVVGPSGETQYSPSDLEELGAMRLSTITPWREELTDFDGVLLQTVLEANGIGVAQAIRVVAENGYAIEIERSFWETWPVLVATRVNGKAHSRRERGPIQFILPMSDDVRSGEGANASNWVWMAERIEPIY